MIVEWSGDNRSGCLVTQSFIKNPLRTAPNRLIWGPVWGDGGSGGLSASLLPRPLLSLASTCFP
jgi:hypothetical protein